MKYNIFHKAVIVLVIMALAISKECHGQVFTNVYLEKQNDITKELSKENRRYIIKDIFDLRGKEITIGANSILDFLGGSFKSGIIKGNKTLILGGPYCLFDEIELTGTFKGESYPEWFKGDVQKCVDHFKVVKFVDEEYVLTKPLDLRFGCNLKGASFNVLRFRLAPKYHGKGCINVAAYSEVSNFIIYVESDNPAIEIKSSYAYSSMSNSDYIQRIAPETTSPGAGTSAAIHIHDLLIRTALVEKTQKKKSTVLSTSPAIWLTGGGGYAAYDKDAHMYRIIKAPGMWGIRFCNIDISGRWLIGIKCEQINQEVTDEEINNLNKLIKDHSPNYTYWDAHNRDVINTLKKEHKWGYGWITGCVFDNIKIHTVMGGIWLGREHNNDGRIISRGTSIQHFMFSNVQMQYWKRTNSDNSINIGPQFFVKMNNCNGITFSNCEPWDWPITTKGIEKPFQIDDSYNVWNVTFQGYSQWHSTTTNLIQYENGADVPLCNEHRVVLSIPESSFGMGNIAVLDDYLDYSHYNTKEAATMKCNKQLRLLPPGTYSIPNVNTQTLKELFKIDVKGMSLSDTVSDAWLEVKLIADPGKSVGTGTQFRRIITIHFSSGGKMLQKTMRRDDPVDRPLSTKDWYEE